MSKSNSSSDASLQENFTWFCEEWLRLKTKAKETNSDEDWKMYVFFLQEAKQNFTKTYAGMTRPAWMELMENILKTITCELKEIDIKYKRSAR